MKKTFRIAGRVIDRKTRLGAAGLQVEAWDKDLILDDLVGSAVTDEKGAFQMELDESYFKELFLDRQPDLFFKVFHEDKLIESTENSVLWNVKAGDTEITIEVDVPVTSSSGEPGRPQITYVIEGQLKSTSQVDFTEVKLSVHAFVGGPLSFASYRPSSRTVALVL
jgi:hypothetical protein